MADIVRRGMMREISLEGLQMIGAGANGRVFKLNEEQIVKVYNPLTNPYEKIEREKEVAKKAFVKGVPTAISFDIVKVGEEYGMVYEMINAKTLGTVITEHPEMLEEYTLRMTRLLKKLHATSFDTDELPDGRLSLHIHAEIAEKSGLYRPEVIDRLHRFIDDIPVRNTFIHGDFHPGNIMLSGDEMLLIDMGDSSVGHPIIDLLASCQLMLVIQDWPGGTMRYINIPTELAKRVWNIFLREYFDTDDEERLADITKLLRFYCMIRSFPGITFSEIIPEDRREELAGRMSAHFMDNVDNVKLLF